MKIPYINCFACDAKIEGPFEPPGTLPPTVCPHCGEPPTFSFKGNVDEKLKELEAKYGEKFRPVAEPDTIDLVETTMKAWESAQKLMSKEPAAVAVETGLNEALWKAWMRTNKWAHHRGMLN